MPFLSRYFNCHQFKHVRFDLVPFILVISLMLICLAIAQTDRILWLEGNQLADDWNAYNTDLKRPAAGRYMGYVLGVVDAYNGIEFSIPEGTQTRQMCIIVGRWLEEHPETWEKAAVSLVKLALAEKYPKHKTIKK